MKEEVILKVENLSKQYRLGTIGTGTISHDLNRFFAKIRGKEDPFLKIGEVNDRSTKSVSNYVWALKDINFEVNKGEVLGVIGKNGAGKSTLLKILSKVTGPSTGSIKANGRIASLLEVGTGFHPEMTGKENIFLNGAILGMNKKEIKLKLSEIVSFSGCERYIDTPVKRYSSGMKVRLAFAVAAFLEPDILIVDEVLAVGDAEFQKKAIGKMQDISNSGGRTVIFVSHDMTAVGSLCNRSVLLENGKVKLIDKTNNVIDYYLRNSLITTVIKNKGLLEIKNFESNYDSTNLNFSLSVLKINKLDSSVIFFDFALVDQNERIIIHHISNNSIEFNALNSNISVNVESPNLKPGDYSFTLYFYDEYGNEILWLEKFNPITIDYYTDHLSIDQLNKIKSLTVPKIKLLTT